MSKQSQLVEDLKHVVAKEGCAVIAKQLDRALKEPAHSGERFRDIQRLARDYANKVSNVSACAPSVVKED